MIIQLELSKHKASTLVKIAEETDQLLVLEALALSDDDLIVKAVVNNPATSKDIREAIYRKWKDKKSKTHIVHALANKPLYNITISAMVPKELSGGPVVCAGLAKQQEISEENLEKIYNYVNSDKADAFCKKTVLCAMARRENLSEKMVNNLLKCSQASAEIILERYKRFLKVDFSLAQTE